MRLLLSLAAVAIAKEWVIEVKWGQRFFRFATEIKGEINLKSTKISENDRRLKYQKFGSKMSENSNNVNLQSV